MLELGSLTAESSQVGLVQPVCYKFFGHLALWYYQNKSKTALYLKKIQIVMVLIYGGFFCFHVCCSVSLCIHYITPVSLKLFTCFEALPLWEIDGKQDPNPSFLFQTFWLCCFKVNNSVWQYCLGNGYFMVRGHNQQV